MSSRRESLQRFLSEAVSDLTVGNVGYKYLRSRGVEDWQIEQYDIGWTSDDVFLFAGDYLAKVPAGSVVFPLYTPYFGYVGFMYRMVEDRAFGHIVVPGTETFPRFIANRTDLEQVFLNRNAILVEGPFDKFAASLIFSNVLGVATSTLSRAQGAYLSPIVDVVLCLFDMDQEGERGWKDLSKRFADASELFRVRLPYNDPSKCLDEMGKSKFVENIKELVESLLFVA